MNAAVTVCWDGAGVPAAPDGIGVIGLRGQPDRETARLAIRAVLRDALAAHCAVDAARVTLHAAPGVAPWAVVDADGAPRRVALAISHDGDISVAAYALDGLVGIDVSRIVPVPDWEMVARDYLAPGVAQALAALAPDARDAAFAAAWSEHEARLKCLGWQLEEWRDDRAAALQSCRSLPLVLPEGYAGFIAMKDTASTSSSSLCVVEF